MATLLAQLYLDLSASSQLSTSSTSITTQHATAAISSAATTTSTSEGTLTRAQPRKQELAMQELPELPPEIWITILYTLASNTHDASESLKTLVSLSTVSKTLRSLYFHLEINLLATWIHANCIPDVSPAVLPEGIGDETLKILIPDEGKEALKGINGIDVPALKKLGLGLLRETVKLRIRHAIFYERSVVLMKESLLRQMELEEQIKAETENEESGLGQVETAGHAVAQVVPDQDGVVNGTDIPQETDGNVDEDADIELEVENVQEVELHYITIEPAGNSAETDGQDEG